MKECPVCNIEISDDFTGLCTNPNCPWEFELFGGDLSSETQKSYNDKLLKAKAIFKRTGTFNYGSIEAGKAKELIEIKAKEWDFILSKGISDTKQASSGTTYLSAFFDRGVLYCHASGRHCGKVFFVWQGINWYYQKKMKGAQDSLLGLPITDEYSVNEKNPFMSRNDFENGYIEYTDTYNSVSVFQVINNKYKLIEIYKFD